MARLRIVPLDDTAQTANVLEFALWRRFRFDLGALEKQCTSLWFLHLPAFHNWTMEDADFMNNLADKQDWIAGWNYQDRY
jgi:hypothetical protein